MTIPYQVPIRVPIRITRASEGRPARRDPSGRRRMVGKCSVADREGYCRGCEQDALGMTAAPRHRAEVAS